MARCATPKPWSPAAWSPVQAQVAAQAHNEHYTLITAEQRGAGSGLPEVPHSLMRMLWWCCELLAGSPCISACNGPFRMPVPLGVPAMPAVFSPMSIFLFMGLRADRPPRPSPKPMGLNPGCSMPGDGSVSNVLTPCTHNCRAVCTMVVNTPTALALAYSVTNA